MTSEEIVRKRMGMLYKDASPEAWAGISARWTEGLRKMRAERAKEMKLLVVE